MPSAGFCTCGGHFCEKNRKVCTWVAVQRLRRIQKPSTPPLDCLEGMPLPKTDRELGELAAFLLEKVGAGQLAVSDADAVMALAKRRVDFDKLGRPFRFPEVEL